MIRKKTLLLAIVIVGLLLTTLPGIQMVKATTGVMVDLPWGRVIGVNQSTEFTASGNGGTPPYTFQWYTTFLYRAARATFKQWVASLRFLVASFSTFLDFVASISRSPHLQFQLTTFQKEKANTNPPTNFGVRRYGSISTHYAFTVVNASRPTVSFTLWHTDYPVIQAPTSPSCTYSRSHRGRSPKTNQFGKQLLSR